MWDPHNSNSGGVASFFRPGGQGAGVSEDSLRFAYPCFAKLLQVIGFFMFVLYLEAF